MCNKKYLPEVFKFYTIFEENFLNVSRMLVVYVDNFPESFINFGSKLLLLYIKTNFGKTLTKNLYTRYFYDNA